MPITDNASKIVSSNVASAHLENVRNTTNNIQDQLDGVLRVTGLNLWRVTANNWVTLGSAQLHHLDRITLSSDSDGAAPLNGNDYVLAIDWRIMMKQLCLENIVELAICFNCDENAATADDWTGTSIVLKRGANSEFFGLSADNFNPMPDLDAGMQLYLQIDYTPPQTVVSLVDTQHAVFHSITV